MSRLTPSITGLPAPRLKRLVEDTKAKRAADYLALTNEFSARYQATVLETFWLVKAVLAEIPLAAVQAVADRADVLYISPQVSGEPPPSVSQGRIVIASDPYFDPLYGPLSYFALLDSGVRSTHVTLSQPVSGYHGVLADCVFGDSNCWGGNPQDDCNHGTSSADILAGDSDLGDNYRGVTPGWINSFKVYNSCGLDVGAAVRAFQRAIVFGSIVIVAEMQMTESDNGTIAAAADNAFDAGCVVIAANGNYGPGASTVASPAIAHKAIGVGGVDAYTLAQYDGQSRGPAPDGRTKPDIQTPTNSAAASNISDTSVQVFSGTSGATPYGAGAASLLDNYLRGCIECLNPEPGQVYAHLILSGQQPYPFNNTVGAGRLHLPDKRGQIWWGKVSVSNGQTTDVPLDVNTSVRNILDGALWWPESQSQAHNNINLSLVNPSGVELALSTDSLSVFQRARVSQSLVSGTWMLRIRGNSVSVSPQTVYWAALTSKAGWL
jgi:serine protease AprX